MSTRSAEEIWEAAKGALQIQLTKANYDTWLRDTTGLSFQEKLFIIGTPSTFASEWLERRLHSMVKKTLIAIIGQDVEVHFQVYTQQPAAISLSMPAKAEVKRPPSPFPPPALNHRYTFDTFVVGSCNRLAHAAALAVAENPGYGYNPLFIYGGVGLGKTHLLHAIGHVALAEGYRLLYVSTEQFTNEFIKSIKDRKVEDFHNKFRKVDLLLIDDIQFISGKEQTQEGFFHTFNDLHNANRQIVLTSDRPPKSLSLLEDRLRSRFEWGLIADVQPPDLETHMAILQAKAEEHKTSVGEQVVEFIARRAQKNIRELEGSLNRVIAFATLNRVELTVEVAELALQDVGIGEARQRLLPNLVIEVVSTYFNLSPDALTGDKREQPIALARQIAMYLIREETSSSLAEIGRLLGGRDHSTILHGYEKIATQIDLDSRLRNYILEIRESLYPKPIATKE